MTTISIGGLTFHGSPRHPSGMHFRDLVDWEGLPPSKSPIVQRPGRHGAFGAGDDYREGVAASFEGFCRGVDRADALLKRRAMTAALAGSGLRMTVTDELGSTSRDVSVRRARLAQPIDARFEYSVDVYASDPRRYGDTVVQSTTLPAPTGGLSWPLTWPLRWGDAGASGRIELVNDGSTDSYPTFTVTGELTGGFSLTEVGSGREIRLERLIPANSAITVVTRTGRAYIDTPANDVSGFLTRAEWSPVPAGSSAIVQFNKLGDAAGSPTLTGEIAPAYW